MGKAKNPLMSGYELVPDQDEDMPLVLVEEQFEEEVAESSEEEDFWDPSELEEVMASLSVSNGTAKEAAMTDCLSMESLAVLLQCQEENCPPEDRLSLLLGLGSQLARIPSSDMIFLWSELKRRYSLPGLRDILYSCLVDPTEDITSEETQSYLEAQALILAVALVQCLWASLRNKEGNTKELLAESWALNIYSLEPLVDAEKWAEYWESETTDSVVHSEQ